MTGATHAEEFQQLGFTAARSFYEPKEIEWMVAETQRAGGTSDLDKGPLRFYTHSYKRSKPIQDLLAQPRLIDFLMPILGPDFWVRGDQMVYKGPGAPEFPWHQDNGYSRLKDIHFQLWIALSKMDASRGGLWLAPRSHKRGPLSHKTVGAHKVFRGAIGPKACIEAEVGDIILFSSMMLHYTSPNASNFDRYAYVVEFMRLDDLDPFVDPPFFIVARGGKACPEFVDNYPARKMLGKQMMYLGLKIALAGKRSLRNMAQTSAR
jgi:hypothetical protein